MYFQKSHFIAVTFYIQMVYSDLTLSESGPPYYCGKGLKLKCWSDSVACCNLTTKRWTLQGTQIMNDGVDVSGTGKYTETRNDAEKYFELTIKNLQPSDFGKEYACLYEFDTSPGLTLKASRVFCSPCGHCGGRCYGWSCFGTTVGFFLMYFVIHVSITKGFIDWKQHDENDEDKKCVEGKCCTNIWCRGLIAVVISFVMSLIAVPIGIEYCFCYEFVDKAYKSYPDPSFIVLGFVVVIFAFPTLGCCLILKDRKGKAICFLILCGLSAGILLLVFLIFCTEFFKRIKAKVGSDVHLECPHKEDAVGQINWIKINGTRRITYSEGTSCNLKDLPKQLIDRLTVKGRDLLISNVQESDTGIYACELIDGAAAPQVAKLELTVLSGENSQSVESGSSCWPICRVGQDPNTSSSDPEKVRRSPKKESADKKPTGFVRPQPSKAQHLGTDNTGRAEYSAENEMYSEKLLKSNKPRLLPSIGQQTDSPRPLPQMPASAQQGGNQLAPLEKKKKKRKKKREAKQSDEENSTEL